MTTETFPGPSSHTVSGTGPYEVGFGYSLGAITVFVEIDGEPVALAPEDYTVDPLYGVNGDVTLSGTAAATHDGRTLKIDRETEMQQGWAGYGNEREAGLELQLDRNVQALQDAARKIGRSLSVSGSGAIPPLTPADGKTIVWNAAEQKFENGPTIDEVADAQQYATSAQAWAINPEDTEVEPGSYSALHHATKAQAAKTASETARGAAESAASAASSDASAAANAAANASTSEANAAASASAAAASEANVASDASTASTAASNAATSETNAASSASAALSSRTAAEAARDQTLAAFDSFDDRYLGPKSSNPTLDNDDDPLVSGALYFNTTAGEMRVYTGATWVSAYVTGTGFLAASQNLSDLDDAAAALANLSLTPTASEINAIAGAIVEFSGNLDDPDQLPTGFYRVRGDATGDKPLTAFNLLSMRRSTGSPYGNTVQVAFADGTNKQYQRGWNGTVWTSWVEMYSSDSLPAVLKDIRDMSLTEGSTLYYDGSNLVNLGIGTAGQILQVNSGATAPEWGDPPSMSSPTVTAGDVPSWGRNDDVTVSENSGRSWQEAFVFPAIGCSGTIRIYVELNNPAVGNQASARYKVNGDVLATSGSVSGWDSYVADLSVSPGDIVTVETNTGGVAQNSNHDMRNPQIRTSAFEPGVISPYYHHDNQFYG